jgi:hypothetical protein
VLIEWISAVTATTRPAMAVMTAATSDALTGPR